MRARGMGKRLVRGAVLLLRGADVGAVLCVQRLEILRRWRRGWWSTSGSRGKKLVRGAVLLLRGADVLCVQRLEILRRRW